MYCISLLFLYFVNVNSMKRSNRITNFMNLDDTEMKLDDTEMKLDDTENLNQNKEKEEEATVRISTDEITDLCAPHEKKCFVRCCCWSLR